MFNCDAAVDLGHSRGKYWQLSLRHPGFYLAPPVLAQSFFGSLRFHQTTGFIGRDQEV